MTNELARLIAQRTQIQPQSNVEFAQYQAPSNNRNYQPEWWEILGRSIVPSLINTYEGNRQEQAKAQKDAQLANVLQQMPEGEERINFLLKNGLTAEAMAVSADMQEKQDAKDALRYELEQKKEFIFDPQNAMEQAKIDEQIRSNKVGEGINYAGLDLKRAESGLRQQELKQSMDLAGQEFGFKKDQLTYERKLLKATTRAKQEEEIYEKRKEIINYVSSQNQALEQNATVQNFRNADNNLQYLIFLENDPTLSPQLKEYSALMVYLKTQNNEAVNEGDIINFKNGGSLFNSAKDYAYRLQGQGTSLKEQTDGFRVAVANKAKVASEVVQNQIEQAYKTGQGLTNDYTKSELDNLGSSLTKSIARTLKNYDSLKQKQKEVVGFGGTRYSGEHANGSN